MASVELKPGDTLNIVWSSIQDTPLGVKTVESRFAYTYEELLDKLTAHQKGSKSRRSGTEGAKFSRIVALATNALKKGKWSTGATIDKNEVFENLMMRFIALPEIEYENITSNAKTALEKLHQEPHLLSDKQQTELNSMLSKLKLL